MRITIKHGETEVEFEGDYEEVWRSINRYFSETYPTLEAVKKLTGAVDINELIDKLKGLVEIRDGKINVLSETDAKKKILICLAAAYIGKSLGLLEKDKLAPKEVAAYTGLDERVTRARLSELRKAGLVLKNEKGLYSCSSSGFKLINELERR